MIQQWHVSYGLDGFKVVLQDNPFWSAVRLEFWGWLCAVTRHRFCYFITNRMKPDLERESTRYVIPITRDEANVLCYPAVWNWLDYRDDEGDNE